MSIATFEFPRRGAAALAPKTARRIQARMFRDGAVAFENLFPRSILEKARKLVLRRHESGELRERGLVRDIGGRYAAVLPFEGVFLEPEFYANPLLHGMLRSLLGPDYCISSLETVISLPGAVHQHQHIDGPIRFDRVVGNSRIRYKGDLSDLPPFAVTLCAPLCDLDETNGPTAIWVGSHRTALRARPPGAAEVARTYPEVHMAGKFGRTFMFDYRTFHGGMPNMSREPRPLLMFVFTRSWYRDPNLVDVNPGVVISRRNLAKVPERHRPLFLLAPTARRALWAS